MRIQLVNCETTSCEESCIFALQCHFISAMRLLALETTRSLLSPASTRCANLSQYLPSFTVRLQKAGIRCVVCRAQYLQRQRVEPTSAECDLHVNPTFDLHPENSLHVIKLSLHVLHVTLHVMHM